MNRLPARARRPFPGTVVALAAALAACASPRAPIEAPEPPPEVVAAALESGYELEAALATSAGFESEWGLVLPEAPSRAERFTGLRRPYAVDYDSRGRLVISDPGAAALVRIDRDERRIEVLGAAGRGRLERPLGLGIGPDDVVLVADADRREVLAFDASGTVVRRYGGPLELLEPTDVAVSPDGARLFVTDSGRHRIVVFDRASGEYVETLGRQGRAAGELFYPSGLTFDREGRLIVADQANSRVQLLTETGDPLEVWERPRRDAGFDRPRDVAVDERGFVYVTDYDRGILEVLSPDGHRVTSLGGRGREPGSFRGLSGVAARGDEIAAVDSLGGRLQVFRRRAAPPARPRAADRPETPPAAPAPAAPPPVEPEPAAPREPVVARPPAPPPPEPVTEETLPAPAPAVDPEQAARAMVAAWARAWAGQDAESYLSFYSARFRPPGALGREAWEEQRRQRLAAPEYIEVTLENLEVEAAGAGQVRIRFLQTYRSDRYTDRVLKTLELALEGGDWKILSERAADAP